MTQFLRRMIQTCYLGFLGLWAGSVWAIGLIVVPVLFWVLDKTHAADTAVSVFQIQGLVGFACLTLLLACWPASKLGKTVFFALWIALLGGLALHVWVVPQLLENRELGLKEPGWHLGASLLYDLQMLCSAFALLRRKTQPS